MTCSARTARRLFLLALLLGFGLRLFMVFTKVVYAHDESITYLAATGHQGEWGRIHEIELPPLATWTPASTYQRYLQPEDTFVFGRIAADLAHYDVHPPLYFWLMHLWVLVFGTGLYSGPLLNVLLDVITAVVLLRFAFAVLDSWPQAQLVTALWMLSPTTIYAGLEARQYNLLALLTLLTAFSGLRLIRAAGGTRAEQVGGIVSLAVSAAAGLLTHYGFGLMLLGVSGAVILTLGLHRPAGAFSVGLALGLAGLGVLLLHPLYLTPVRSVVEVAAAESLLQRIMNVGFALLQLGLDDAYLYAVYVFFTAAYVGGIGVLLMLAGRRSPAQPVDAAGPEPALRYVGWVLAGTVLSIVGPYLLGLTPSHAMAPRYMAPVAVFAAFLPLLLTQQPHRDPYRGRLLTGAIILLLISSFGTAFTLVRGAQINAQNSGADLLADPAARQVVFDSNRRGVIFPTLLRLDPDAAVFIATEDALLADPAAWLPELAAEPGLFINASLTYNANSPEKLQTLLDRLAAEGLDVSEAAYLGEVTAFLVQPAP